MAFKMWRIGSLLVIGVSCVLSGCTGPGGTAAAPTTSGGARICQSPILRSPWNYDGEPGTFSAGNEPRGLPTIGSAKSDFPNAVEIVVVPAGDNTAAALQGSYQVNDAVVYFEPGMHHVERVMYTGNHTAYVGGYTKQLGGAIINGVNGATGGTGKGGSPLASSKASSGSNVYDTWEYLQIENYTASVNNAIMGNVNGGGSDVGDTYKYDTIGPNDYGYNGTNSRPRQGESSGGGYGIDAGSYTAIEYDCLTHNAQGAFNITNAEDVTIAHNEISWNGIGEYPDTTGSGASPFSCGCSGGGKLFFTLNANVVGNYVHDNYNTGIWFDFDNAGANISDNYIASNWGSGIAYEASYNANIAGNVLVGNGWASDHAWPAGVGGGTCLNGVPCSDGLGPVTGAGGGNPYAAIDLSDSGGNGNLKSRYAGEILVANNSLTNNFGGVKVYTDTNRYPGNIDDDSSCSIPLGVLNQTNSNVFYRQGRVLTTNGDSTITGSSVRSAGGTKTLCAPYGSDAVAGFQAIVQAPAVGMAVFDESTGAFLGTVASVSSANSFSLSRSPGNVSGASLLLSAYGGCGPADYYGGGLNVASGEPAAQYWDNCLWGSRNVSVTGNTFRMQASTVNGCNAAKNLCGYMELAAFNAGVPKLMRFFNSYSTYISKASGGLGDVWSDNTYDWTGGGAGWRFMAGLQGIDATWAQWRAAPNHQDAGSVLNG